MKLLTQIFMVVKPLPRKIYAERTKFMIIRMYETEQWHFYWRTCKRIKL